VDRNLLRALLDLTPAERLNLGLPSSRAFIEFERAARRRAELSDAGGSLFAEQVVDELDVLEDLREELGRAADGPASRKRVE